MKTRQKVRRGLLYGMFALLPVTLYYLSPVLCLSAAAEGILSGSLVLFVTQFILSLFLGRLFCGWVCPAGGLQELVLLLRRKPVQPRRIAWIKYLVWAPWLGGLVFLFLRARGVRRVDFFYQTAHGISVTDMAGLIACLSVILLFFTLSVTIGRRAGCHTVCWMAPFMVIGRKIRNRVGWPALALASQSDRCTACGACNRACPMSIDVKQRISAGDLESPDCILCVSCVDACPASVIRPVFAKRRVP